LAVGFKGDGSQTIRVNRTIFNDQRCVKGIISVADCRAD